MCGGITCNFLQFHVYCCIQGVYVSTVGNTPPIENHDLLIPSALILQVRNQTRNTKALTQQPRTQSENTRRFTWFGSQAYVHGRSAAAMISLKYLEEYRMVVHSLTKKQSFENHSEFNNWGYTKYRLQWCANPFLIRSPYPSRLQDIKPHKSRRVPTSNSSRTRIPHRIQDIYQQIPP